MFTVENRESDEIITPADFHSLIQEIDEPRGLKRKHDRVDEEEGRVMSNVLLRSNSSIVSQSCVAIDMKCMHDQAVKAIINGTRLPSACMPLRPCMVCLPEFLLPPFLLFIISKLPCSYMLRTLAACATSLSTPETRGSLPES